MADFHNDEELEAIRATCQRATVVSEEGTLEVRELQERLHHALRSWAKMYVRDVKYLYERLSMTNAENEKLKEEIVELRREIQADG